MADTSFVSRVSHAGQVLAVLLTSAMMLIAGLVAPLRADQSASPSSSGATSPESERLKLNDTTADRAPGQAETWFRELAPNTVIRPESNQHARNHVSVLNAFRSAVGRPAKSTVRVRCGGRQVALGAIIDADGYIATKASELTGVTSCELADGTRYDAELVSVDRGSDLGLLKISAQGLPTIRWSEDDPPAVGGWVITPGLTDVPEAIGIVSVAPHHVRGGVLGIQMTEDTPGPRITFVVPGSGAAAASLVAGDVITHVNGHRMRNSSAMVALTSNLLPGDELEMTILRNREVQSVVATLGSVADTLLNGRARFQERLGARLSDRRVLFPSALEHDSVLNPNDCGGALVDLDGHVIGINIARASRIASYAIPADVARPILDSLKSQATQSRVVLPVATSGAHGPAPVAATDMDRVSAAPRD